MTIPQLNYSPLFQAFNAYSKAREETGGGNDPLYVMAKTGLSIAEIGVGYVASADQAAAKDRVTGIEKRFQDATARYTKGIALGGIGAEEYAGELDALRSELKAARGTARTEYGREVFDSYETNGFTPNYIKVTGDISKELIVKISERVDANALKTIEEAALTPDDYAAQRASIQKAIGEQESALQGLSTSRAAAESAYNSASEGVSQATAPKEKLERLKELKTHIAGLLKKGPGDMPEEVYQREILKAREEQSQLESELRGLSPAQKQADYTGDGNAEANRRYAAWLRGKGIEKGSSGVAVPGEKDSADWTDEEWIAWGKSVKAGKWNAFAEEDGARPTPEAIPYDQKIESDYQAAIARREAASTPMAQIGASEAIAKAKIKEEQEKLASMPDNLRDKVRSDLEREIVESRLLEGRPEKQREWVEGKLRQFDERRVTAASESLVKDQQFIEARELVEGNAGSFTSPEAKKKALDEIERQRAQFSTARDGLYMAAAQDPFKWDVAAEVKALRDAVGLDKTWEAQDPEGRQATFNKLDRRWEELLADEKSAGAEADKFYINKAQEIVEARRRGDISTQAAALALDALKQEAGASLPVKLWTDSVKEIEDMGARSIPAGKDMMDRAEAFVQAGKTTLSEEHRAWILDQTRKWASSNISASTPLAAIQEAEMDIKARWYTKEIAKKMGLSDEAVAAGKPIREAVEQFTATIKRDLRSSDGKNIAKGLAPVLGKIEKDGTFTPGMLGSQINLDPYSGAVDAPPDVKEAYLRAQQFTTSALIQQHGASLVGSGMGAENAVIVPHEDGSWHYNILGKDGKKEKVLIPIADESNALNGVRFIDALSGTRSTGATPARQSFNAAIDAGAKSEEIIAAPIASQADYTARQKQLSGLRDMIDTRMTGVPDLSYEDRERVKAIKAIISQAEADLVRKQITSSLGYDPGRGGAFPAGSRGR